MSDIILIYGTRPEAIKLGVVAHELRKLDASVVPLCTGQHTDLLRGTPAETDLAGGISLNLASDGDVARWITRAQDRLRVELERFAEAIVVVQGDTMTVQTGAEVASLLEMPLVHVEAGIRSHDLNNPWPEERTRVAVAQLANWHYAPTTKAFANLVMEGVRGNTIAVTGNTVVSALRRYAATVRPVTTPSERILITLHRSEVKQPKVANALYGAIRVAALRNRTTDFVWPMHPVMQRLVERVSPEPSNLHLIEPLEHLEFLQKVASAKGVLTDSGGLSEEAATLGVPTAIMRDVNDRPEAEAAGIAVRFPPTASGVFAAVDVLLDGELVRGPRDVFAGDGDPASDIAKRLARLAG